ncbi:hypothetical protein COCSADRAFT_254143 [Bipolaris sorokiniana ND90Pr]|uniref:Uncharacterized protein n=1 Tax=Cochliobolus sativus (strain ND90Pr / ATCC 201652) TaxID=665912 RepID=M2RXK1_COCSN|nr:uncharacterized protein COCSADRAFT_254143 [Bipolaris sorokiniana ND90Pr]EMD59788.1 hypothetical protein COCSADRAFT_254143 [Bipolaris sorokiniana ND90Pr]
MAPSPTCPLPSAKPINHPNQACWPFRPHPLESTALSPPHRKGSTWLVSPCPSYQTSLPLPMCVISL